jgi:hypothetical protein
LCCRCYKEPHIEKKVEVTKFFSLTHLFENDYTETRPGAVGCAGKTFLDDDECILPRTDGPP